MGLLDCQLWFSEKSAASLFTLYHQLYLYIHRWNLTRPSCIGPSCLSSQFLFVWQYYNPKIAFVGLQRTHSSMSCPFSLLLRSLTLNTTVQMHLNRSEWKRRVTSLLKNVGLPYHKDTSLIYGQLLVNHNSLNLSVRLFFKLVNLQCARDCSFPDKRDTLPLPSLQLHGVPVSSCLHAAQVPWTSILWTALIKHLV